MERIGIRIMMRMMEMMMGMMVMMMMLMMMMKKKMMVVAPGEFLMQVCWFCSIKLDSKLEDIWRTCFEKWRRGWRKNGKKGWRRNEGKRWKSEKNESRGDF